MRRCFESAGRRGRALLVCSIAVLSISGLAAAELPNLRAPPPKPAKKCQIGGMQGVLVPGTSMCVKVSGYVSGEVAAGNVRPH